jgi:hypothetical protein
VQNKVGQFLTSPLTRNIVGQVKSKIDMGFMMDNLSLIAPKEPPMIALMEPLKSVHFRASARVIF